MKYLIFFTIIFITMTGCYPSGTTSTYNQEFTWGRSSSKPIYLSFKRSREIPFYFVLNRDSREFDYHIIVRWISPKKGELLFNGMDTTLKFLIDREQILSYKPINRPRIVCYNLDYGAHEEEAIFSVNPQEFMKIAYAESVSVELLGRNNISIGYFSKLNTIKSFKEFAETSY
jgi:hypothetical protein